MQAITTMGRNIAYSVLVDAHGNVLVPRQLRRRQHQCEPRRSCLTRDYGAWRVSRSCSMSSPTSLAGGCHIFDLVGGTSPVPRRIRSAWREAPVLEKMFARCVFAVVPAILSAVAVSFRAWPPRRLASTRVSAGVRPKAAAILDAASCSSAAAAMNTAAIAAG
jgi:hypothetical protein